MPKQAPKFEFDAATHRYTADGELWPSVTQLLNEFGLIDFSAVEPGVLERKRELGTIVHRASHLLDEQRLDEKEFERLFPEAVPYLNAYRRFREIEDFEPAFLEHRLWSPKWRFAGTLDRQGIYKGRTALIDLKCTWELYPSNGPQTAGYDMLMQENHGIKSKLRFGLQLKPTGAYELVPFERADDYSDFKACVMLHWQKRLKYKTSKGEPKP